MRRIVFFGAGSIGCYVGGLWAAAGLPVTFVGRERIRTEVAANGLHLTDGDGGEVRLPPSLAPFVDAEAALRETDLVVLAVKGLATRDTAREVALHAPPAATIVTLQNGISPPGILRKELPGRTVLRGIVGFNVVAEGGGRFHRGTAGHLWIEDHPAIRPFADHLADTPAAVTLRSDMEAVAWGKLLLNLNNAVNALSGLTLREELSQRAYRRVLAASQREALAVMRAAGIAPARVTALPPALLPAFVALPDPVFNTIGLRMQKIDAHARSSMADDLAAGRPTEIDFINGEIVALARRLGVGAPVNERLVALVREAEAGGRRDWSGDELLRAATS